MTDQESKSNAKNLKYLAMIPRGLQEAIISISLSKTLDSDAICETLKDDDEDRILNDAIQRIIAKNSKRKKKKNGFSYEGWFQQPVGTIEIDSRFHVSLGYTSDGNSIWTCPGTVSGSSWLYLQTKEIFTSRCIGPLMALIQKGKVKKGTEACLQDIVSEIGAYTHTTTYRNDFDNALELWKLHVSKVWESRLTTDDYDELKSRINSDQLRFRLSCVREDSDLSYSRRELLESLMDKCEGTLVPYESNWKVNLTNFDVEIVLVILKNGTVTIGISLLPYSFFKSKSFESGGTPPDLTDPYIGGDILKDILRLRLTTAHIMLELADIQPHEIVVDPCAGIGTIPIESEQYFPFRTVGIGGDIVLDHSEMKTATFAMESKAKRWKDSSNNFSRLSVAWDAALLPMRTGVVDAVVSDLPFGKMCLSSSTLNQLLPLVMVECARALVPSTGRMLVLCGSPDAMFRALEEHSKYWKMPCTMVTPINIGGLLAWMVRVERSNVEYNPEEARMKTISRIRALTKKRDTRRFHASKKRRIQSKS
jgi:hypothetical protein